MDDAVLESSRFRRAMIYAFPNRKGLKVKTDMKKTVFSSLVLASFLTACWVPEKFNADLDVQQDGGAVLKYDGTMAHVLVLSALADSSKPIPDKEVEGLKRIAESMSKKEGVEKATYEGNGRMYLRATMTSKPGAPLNMMDVLQVSTDKSGVITIRSPKMSPSDIEKMKKLNLALNGTLNVKLPKNAVVISHNATSEPKLFGLVGAYTWKIGSVSDGPEMKVTLKK